MKIHHLRKAALAFVFALGMGFICPVFGDNIALTTSVSAAAGNVVFEVTAPSVGGKYGQSGFSFSEPWLSKPSPASQANEKFFVTLSVAANTGAARTATCTCLLNGNNVTLTVNQAAGNGGTPISVIALAKTVSDAAQTVVFSDTRLAEVWTASIPNEDWITQHEWSGDDYVIVIAANTGSERSVTVSLYADKDKTQFAGTLTLTQAAGSSPVIPTPTSNFGPGNASEFYVSQTEKAFVVGVYGLDWRSFPVRAFDGFHVYTDSQIIDREKGSGASAPDHQWCDQWSVMDMCIWAGWAQKVGFSDEDAFAATLLAQNKSPMEYIYEKKGIDLWGDGYFEYYTPQGAFAQTLASRFAGASQLAELCVFFDNYNWYGEVGPIGHAVVCCGYSLDTTKALSDPKVLKGLFIIDPDNDRENKGGGASAPDTITYCPVEWDAAERYYRIWNIFGAIGYVWDAYFLSTADSVSLRKSSSDYIGGSDATIVLTKDISAAGGNVVFEVTAPSVGGTYGQSGFEFSESWLSKPFPASQANEKFSVTLSVAVNTGAARTATCKCFLNGNVVTLTVNQAAGNSFSLGWASSSGRSSGQSAAPVETVVAAAAAEYNGFFRNANGTVVGSVYLKIAKAGKNGESKVTGSVQMMGEKKTAVKGSFKAGVLTVPGFTDVALDANGVTGSYGAYSLDGARNVFSAKDAASKATATAAMSAYKGAYTVAWQENGLYGGLTVTVGKKGKARVAGFLPDGTKVSAGGQLMLGDGDACVTVVSTNKKVPLAFNLWFANGTMVADGLGDAAMAAKVGGLASGKSFKCSAMGGAVVPVMVNGMKWVVTTDKATSLKLSFTAKTGAFKGSFKVGNQKATVNGVVIDGVGYGSAVIKNGSKSAVTID